MSISIRDITVTASSNQTILSRLTLELRPGEITLLIGPTGSGKSTLLRAISGLIPLTAGTVKYAERNLWQGNSIDSDLQKRFALVFQSPEQQLFARTVQGEFDYSLRPYKLSQEEKRERIEDALSSLQLPASMLRESPLTLSQGQKRRIALATTLATRPEWLFLDEPTAGLDPRTAIGFSRTLMHKFSPTTGGIVIATHDLDTFFTVAHRVILLSGGKSLAQGTPQELIEKHGTRLEQTIGLPTSVETAMVLAANGIATSSWPVSARALAEEIARTSAQSVIEAQGASTWPIQSSSQWRNSDRSGNASNEKPKSESIRPAAPVLSLPKRLDTRVKWGIYILLSIAYVLQNHILGLIVSTAVAWGIIVLGEVSVRQLLRLIRPFAYFITISVLFSGLQLHAAHGWLHHLGYAPAASFRTLKSLYKILLIMILGIVLTETTSQLQMKMGIERSLAGLKKIRVPVEAIALGTSLTLRFIPLITREADRFSAIARSRGKSSVRPGQIRLRDMRAVVIPLLISVFQLGEDLSFAMELRGYDRIGKPRTSSIEARMTKLDWTAMAIGVMLFAGLLLLT